MAPELSVVVPVYGCGPCLHELHRRTAATLDALELDYEIVLVDDCADDGAWEAMQAVAAQDPRVRGLRLSRNFGQHAAITAGLAQARGDRVVVMDCDLQDPPEEIPKLYAKALEGYDIVLGRRSESRHHRGRRLGSRLYFHVMSTFTGLPFDGSFGTFSIISRKVVDAFLQFQDQDRHYLFILNWLGFNHTAIDYDHRERPVGKSSYSVLRLLQHALDGLFFQTTVALRFIVAMGFVMAGLGALVALYLVTARATGSAAPGWTSLAVFTLTIGGFTVISTGVTGIYVGKVFDQVKGRPLFVVDQTTWASPEESAGAVRAENVADRA
ncbi:MAG: glycosyl transferase family 2 [Conexibacter sp.]|nr:glycosyl transferase family 2 [Conexibacter sp.]